MKHRALARGRAARLGGMLVVLAILAAGLWWSARPAGAGGAHDLSGLPALAVGDWLLRLGRSADSVLVHQLGGGDYSHIGMVVATEPEVLVVHATTDDDPSRPDQVLLSRLDAFLAPDLARHFAVLRPDFLDAPQKRAAARALLAQVGEPFVLEVRERPHRYCTTLLAEAISAQQGSFLPGWTRLDNPFYRGEFLFPRAFADYPGVTWLYRR